jgi:hypothetical protein
VLNESNEQLNNRDSAPSLGPSRGVAQPREAQQEIFQSSLGVPIMNTATSSGLVPSRVAARGNEVSEENSAKDSEIKRLKDENNKLEQQLSNLRVSFSLF